MLFTGTIKEIQKSTYKKDGKENELYTVCIQESNPEKQFPDSIALNIFGDNALMWVDQYGLDVGTKVIAYYNASYRKHDKDGKTFISNSLTAWKIVKEEEIMPKPNDDLPF